MKKYIAIWAIASALTIPSSLTAQEPRLIKKINATSSRVAWIVSKQEKILPANLVYDIEEARKDKGVKRAKNNPNLLLFPPSVQSIGLHRIRDWLLWNMSHWWLVEWINPLMVDVEWEEQVNCAATMKSIIAFSKNPSDRLEAENEYVRKESVDAWTLPEELKNLWFKQVINLMKYFDKSWIWKNDIVEDKISYKSWLQEIWDYLKNNWKVWSMLFIYFNLSDYRGVVKNYNLRQKENNPNYPFHFNTHQAMFLWNGFMEFKANDIKVVSNSKLSEMQSEIDIIDFIANFIQFRWWYKSALSDETKKVIKENLKTFYKLIEISINWETISLWEELNKPQEERKKVKKEDVIKITGPVLIDWFHNKISENKDISDNNHARSIFYFEFPIIWSYTPSELMEPQDIFYERMWNKNALLQNLTDDLKIINYYYLKRWENIDLKLKEAILRFKLWKQKLLETSQEEIELCNRIQDLKWTKKADELILKLVSLREEKVKNIISNLSPKEYENYEKELNYQINWLQMMGYMQNEWSINDWAAYINRPIPYFDTSNINTIFSKYIEIRKDEIQKYRNSYNNSEDTVVRIFFYPTDNSTSIFNQLNDNLQNYVDKYPNFWKIKDLNLLQRNKFIDLVIDKISDDKKIDVSNWKVPSMRNIVIPLDYIDTVLTELLNETFIEKLPLSFVDKKVIGVIKKTEQDYNILSHIITKENYENWFPWRKLFKISVMKLTQLYNYTIAEPFNLKSYNFSSFWDFQIRFKNLREDDLALKEWPCASQILKAISYKNNPILKEIIERRQMRDEYDEIVEADLKILEEIENELKTLNEEERIEKWKKIYELFKKLFRFNGATEINVVWKIIQASLTLDKLPDHYSHLNWWFEKSWIPLEEIYYNEDLQKRYIKAILIIHNKAEKQALIWFAESYIIRVLESLWDDILDDSYPKLKKTFTWKIITWETIYTDEVKKEHFSYYMDRAKCVANNDSSRNEVKKELIKEIKNIIEKNFNAKDIYRLFKNKTIVNHLENKGYDKYFIPTLDELVNNPFRELIFSYANTPEWWTSPQINDYEKVVNNIWIGIVWLISWLAWSGRVLYKKRKKKNSQNNKSNLNEKNNVDSKEA